MKSILSKASGVLVVLTLMMVPRLSYADWGDHHYYGWHDHPHWGYHVHYLPHGYFRIWVGGAPYYYYDGLYYNYVDGDYVIVAPPVGAVVTTIPSDFQPVAINGGTYYVDNGTYYVYTAQGYQVVSAPATVAQPPVTQPAVVAAPQGITLPPAVLQDAFTVNIPNDHGSYTSVVIKRSGNGYVGPQGEFYPDFPKVAQLRVMYGK